MAQFIFPGMDIYGFGIGTDYIVNKKLDTLVMYAVVTCKYSCNNIIKLTDLGQNPPKLII